MAGRKRLKIKTFRLPLDEDALNRIINRDEIEILDKKIFQDKNGDISVYVEYEEEVTATEGSRDLAW